MRAQAEAWLKEVLGEKAVFRDGQWEAIAALVQRRERVLVVQRTGWGKSMVYFMATRLLRQAHQGVTILISPLLALMRNQIDSAAQWGVRAATINSSNYNDHADVYTALYQNQLDLMLISPERLANEEFQENVWSRLKERVGLLVIDEAHCISDWGHDFRPNYRRIMHILNDLPAKTPVLGTTATANDRVVADVSAILGAQMNIQRGALTRESLRLYVYPEPQEHAQRLTLLSHLLKNIPGCGIIYCTTTRDCRIVAEWLQQEGFDAQPYYAEVEQEIGLSRIELEEKLLKNQMKALVASVALGMGFDKPDLHFVIHYQQPGNVIGYYQQIGRAGRALEAAHIILMHGDGDEDIQRYFIDTAFPTPQQVEETIAAFQTTDKLTLKEFQRQVNARQSVLEKILVHLEVEQIFVRDGRYYRLRVPDARPDYDRWRRVTQQRYHELEQMRAYIRHEGCLMRFLAEALDDPLIKEDCGKCKNCRKQHSKFQHNGDDVERARHFLRGGKPITFEPRKRWASDLPGIKKTTDLRVNETGIALSYYFESGLGEQVKQGHDQNYFSDALVTISAEKLHDYLPMLAVMPQWISAVPSLRRPKLVPDFAQRLAQALNLPFHPVVIHQKQHPAQATRHNSYLQAENVLKAFVIPGKLPAGAVLLIDDIADSRWTLTVIGDLLQRHGCPAVIPFVLALKSGG
jgi:ATP-dependent DNA helicase RecQ